MFKNKKGQSALEYLMTYGWALVVIVIVIAALFAFGVFETQINCRTNSTQLLLTNYAVDSNTIQLNLKNGEPNPIEITGFTGTPDSVTWESGDADLAATDSNVFVLSGAFTGNITEEIVMAYTSSGLAKSAKITCSGSV